MPNKATFLTMAILIRFVEGIGASIQAVAIESTIIIIYRDRIASAKVSATCSHSYIITNITIIGVFIS